MPIQECTLDKKPGYRWGASGKCYTYPRGNETERRKAKHDAIIQGTAIEANGGDKIMKGYSGSGVMVALPIPLEIAGKLGNRSVPADEMHVTLAYLGKVQDVHPDAVKRATEVVKEVALGFRPMKARIGGYGVFKATLSSDGKDVMYASYDCPMLAEFRQQIFNGLREAGVPLKGLAHGFTPHVTTDYIDAGKVIDPPSIPDDEFEASNVSIYIGDVRVDVPLGGENDVVDEADLDPSDQALAAGDISGADVAALKMFGYAMVEKDGGHLRRDVQIISKADGSGMEQLVYGVVLEPGSVDAQDQVVDEDGVKFAAHHFLGVQGIAGYRHREPADATVVESYIAPCDFSLGGQVVKQGSWVIVTRVNDDALWQQIVDGDITGYSVGGFGVLEPLAKPDASA